MQKEKGACVLEKRVPVSSKHGLTSYTRHTEFTVVTKKDMRFGAAAFDAVLTGNLFEPKPVYALPRGRP